MDTKVNGKKYHLLFIVILCLMHGYISAQMPSPEQIKLATKNLKKTRDDFNKTTTYSDKRMTPGKAYDDQMSLVINFPDNGYVFLRFIIAHVSMYNPTGDYLNIEDYILKTGTEVYKLHVFKPEQVTGNGTITSVYQTFISTDSLYDFIRKGVINNDLSVRCQGHGKQHDFKNSKKEIKELRSVIEAFELLGGRNLFTKFKR